MIPKLKIPRLLRFLADCIDAAEPEAPARCELCGVDLPPSRVHPPYPTCPARGFHVPTKKVSQP
jgi:hypothetical protein